MNKSRYILKGSRLYKVISVKRNTITITPAGNNLTKRNVSRTVRQSVLESRGYVIQEVPDVKRTDYKTPSR